MQEPVYVLHLITCHGRIMPRLAELLLGIGITYENFQESGNLPSLIKRLKRIVRGFFTALSTDFNNL